MKTATLRVGERITTLRVEIAENAPERMVGLLGRSSLEDDASMLLRPCNAVHTFGMRFPIDVVFMDRQQRVLEIHQAVVPRRVLFKVRAVQVLELAAGAARRHGIAVGESLDFKVDE